MTTEAYDKQAEDEAIRAAMAESIDVEAPIKEPEPEIEESDGNEVEGVAEQDAEEVAQERVEVVPGFTAEELQAQLAEIPRLQKALDKTNGTYGQRLAEQQKIIDNLRSSKTGATEQAAEHIASLTDEQAEEFFEELKEEFPEVSKSIAKGVSRAINKLSGGRNTDDFEKKLSERLSQYAQEQAEKAIEKGRKKLSKKHPDWQDVATFSQDEKGFVHWKNLAFGQWVQQQPEDVQHDIFNSDDFEDLSEYLDQYKASLEVKHTEPKEVKKTTQQVFGKAVQPKGKKGDKHLTDKELEDEAFRKAMKDDYDF